MKKDNNFEDTVKDFETYSIEKKILFLYNFFKKIYSYKDYLAMKQDGLYHDNVFLNKYVKKYDRYVGIYNQLVAYVDAGMCPIGHFDFYKRGYMSEFEYEDLDSRFNKIKETYKRHLSLENKKEYIFKSELLSKINKDLDSIKSELKHRKLFLDEIGEYEKDIDKDIYYFGMFMRQLIEILKVYDKYIEHHRFSEENFKPEIRHLSVRYTKPSLFRDIATFIDNRLDYLYNISDSKELLSIQSMLDIGEVTKKNFLYQFYINLSKEQKDKLHKKLVQISQRYYKKKEFKTFILLSDYLKELEKVIDSDTKQMDIAYQSHMEEEYKKYGGKEEYQKELRDNAEREFEQEEIVEDYLKEKDIYYDDEEEKTEMIIKKTPSKFENFFVRSDYIEQNKTYDFYIKMDRLEDGYEITINNKHKLDVGNKKSWDVLFEVINVGGCDRTPDKNQIVTNMNNKDNGLKTKLKEEFGYTGKILRTKNKKIVLDESFKGMPLT